MPEVDQKQMIIKMFESTLLLQIDAFMNSQQDLGVASRAFAQSKERAQNNVKYLQKNLQTLTDWLSTATSP
mgnify:CR=1 FL=1